MVKVSKEVRKKIVMMARRAIAEELEFSKSISLQVFRIDHDVVTLKNCNTEWSGSKSSAKENCKMCEGWVQLVQFEVSKYY